MTLGLSSLSKFTLVFLASELYVLSFLIKLNSFIVASSEGDLTTEGWSSFLSSALICFLTLTTVHNSFDDYLAWIVSCKLIQARII